MTQENQPPTNPARFTPLLCCYSAVTLLFVVLSAVGLQRSPSAFSKIRLPEADFFNVLLALRLRPPSIDASPHPAHG